MVKIGGPNRRGGGGGGGRPWWRTWLTTAFVAAFIGLFVMSINLGSSVFEAVATTGSTSTAAPIVDTARKKTRSNVRIVPSSSSTTTTITSTAAMEQQQNQEQEPSRKYKQPPPIVEAAKTIKREDKQLLTYGRFGGRLNNQLYNFVAGLQHATILNRTLVVPPEDGMVRWTGFVDNDLVDLWDLEDLNTHYDIDWETAREEILEVPEEDCKLKSYDRLLTDEINKHKHCKVLDIGGYGGLLFCHQHHRFCGKPEHERVAFDIYQRLHPSKTIQKYVAQFELQNPYPFAVHSRTHGDGPYPSGICLRGNYRVCNPHIEGSLHKTWCNNETLSLDCAKWTNKDLVGQLRNKRAYQELGQGSTQKFVLANDMTHDYDIEFKDQYAIISNKEYMGRYRDVVEKLGGKLECNKDLVKLAKSPYTKKLLSKPNNALFEENLDRLSQILLEVWSLVKPKWMLGNVYSTMSLAVCIMRGEQRKYDSNMCWMLMHPDSRHAIPPT